MIKCLLNFLMFSIDLCLSICLNTFMKTTEQSIKLNKNEDRAVRVMQLLGDKTRYKIFKLMMSGDEMCVSEIADKLNISVSAVSQHFRSFEMIGLVDKERMGQKICYSMKEDDALIKKLLLIAEEN